MNGVGSPSSAQIPTHALDGEPAGGVGAAKDLTPDLEPGKTTWEETMGFLKIMEYRYTRFALEPGSGRWAMIRYVACSACLHCFRELNPSVIGETQGGPVPEPSRMDLTRGLASSGAS